MVEHHLPTSKPAELSVHPARKHLHSSTEAGVWPTAGHRGAAEWTHKVTITLVAMGTEGRGGWSFKFHSKEIPRALLFPRIRTDFLSNLARKPKTQHRELQTGQEPKASGDPAPAPARTVQQRSAQPQTVHTSVGARWGTSHVVLLGHEGPKETGAWKAGDSFEFEGRSNLLLTWFGGWSGRTSWKKEHVK